jgi:hypothetical protein
MYAEGKNWESLLTSSMSCNVLVETRFPPFRVPENIIGLRLNYYTNSWGGRCGHGESLNRVETAYPPVTASESELPLGLHCNAPPFTPLHVHQPLDPTLLRTALPVTPISLQPHSRDSQVAGLRGTSRIRRTLVSHKVQNGESIKWSYIEKWKEATRLILPFSNLFLTPDLLFLIWKLNSLNKESIDFLPSF